MNRLSALDAEFLHIEDGIAHMHIAGVCVFQGVAPSREELTQLIASKLHLLVRYRQRVRSVPFELGRPVWVDDPHFSLVHHIHHIALPSPGNDAVIERLMGQLMSRPLDRDRPLWEAWLIEGVSDGRWAIIFKVHHCMVDGIAGVELLTALLDTEPNTEVGEPLPWSPQPEPNGIAKVIDAWGGALADVGRLVIRPRVIMHPKTLFDSARGNLRGLGEFARHLRNQPSLIDRRISPYRAWSSSSANLADVKKIREVFGGTVNDVVLGAVTAAFRVLLIAQGEDPADAAVRCAIPVSTRDKAAYGTPDNRVTLLLYELPVHIADPVQRLTVVHDEMTKLKSSHMADAGDVLTTLGNLAPPFIVGPVSRLAMVGEQLLPQRSIATITTNVPGPQFPLYCLGRKMLAYQPYVPIVYGIAISTAILSYDGQLYFGITGDHGMASAIDIVADAIPAAIAELCDLVAERG